MSSRRMLPGANRKTPPVHILKQQITNKLARKKKLEEYKGWEGLPDDIGVCWMCWIELTNEDLNEWRNKYSRFPEIEGNKTCPLCGYDEWKGNIWLVKKYLMDIEENPSLRHQPKVKRRPGYTYP